MTTPVTVAFKAHLGWVNAVCVRSGKNLNVTHVERINLFTDTPREISEPYHVAGGWHGLTRVPPPSDPAAVVRTGLAAQRKETLKQLRGWLKKLAAENLEMHRGVILTGAGRKVEGLEHILASHAQIHVAEGEAVRAAVRQALDKLDIAWTDQPEKSIPGLYNRSDVDAWAKSQKPSTGRWGKEERLLALAAQHYAT